MWRHYLPLLTLLACNDNEGFRAKPSVPPFPSSSASSSTGAGAAGGEGVGGAVAASSSAEASSSSAGGQGGAPPCDPWTDPTCCVASPFCTDTTCEVGTQLCGGQCIGHAHPAQPACGVAGHCRGTVCVEPPVGGMGGMGGGP